MALLVEYLRFDKDLVKKSTRFWSLSRMMPLALATPNRGSNVNIATSSNYGPNSPHDATKMWVSMLNHEMRNSRSIGFLSTTINLAWMIEFMIPYWLNSCFIQS